MNRFFKPLLTVALLSTVSITGLGFSSLEALANAGKKNELVYVNYRDIRDLNPHLYAGEMYAQNIIYDGLIDDTANGFAPALAESWEISPDGKTYTFKIRPNVKFTDGEAADAYAIKANFDAIMDNKSRHLWLTMMNLLESTEAPDPHTFIIKMSEPYYPMLTELAMVRPFAFISPKSMKDGKTKDGIIAPIGTGPYKLTDFVIDEYAIFERNEDYWGDRPRKQTKNWHTHPLQMSI